MPSLNNLICEVRVGTSGTLSLKEYGTRYVDGAVETYIAAQDDMKFHIHLTSDGYIAPGLAVYVYIDGVFQCHRNSDSLAVDKNGASFKLYQKEEKVVSNTFVAREWSFVKLRKDVPPSESKVYARNVGTIEVVVLRCDAAVQDLSEMLRAREINSPGSTVGKKSSKKASAVASTAGMGMMMLGGLLDGGDDEPDHDRIAFVSWVSKITSNEAPKRVIKPYWEGANRSSDPANKPAGPRNPSVYPAYPVPVRPAGRADVKYGMQAGPGVDYEHVAQPAVEYIDDFAKPYAVFTFKYRDPATLEEKLGRSIGNSCQAALYQLKKDKLEGMSKEALVEELMQRFKMAGHDKDTTPRRASKNADEIGPSDSISQASGHSARRSQHENKQASAANGGAGGTWSWGNGENNKVKEKRPAVQSSAGRSKKTENDGWKQVGQNKTGAGGSKKDESGGWDKASKGNTVAGGSKKDENGGWDKVSHGNTVAGGSKNSWANAGAGTPQHWEGDQDLANKPVW